MVSGIIECSSSHIKIFISEASADGVSKNELFFCKMLSNTPSESYCAAYIRCSLRTDTNRLPLDCFVISTPYSSGSTVGEGDGEGAGDGVGEGDGEGDGVGDAVGAGVISGISPFILRIPEP